VIEFIGKPVQSLFSTFVSTAQDPQIHSKQWNSGTFDSFASIECRNFSASDLNMIIQHDEDEIKQTRMLTQPTLADLKKLDTKR
jgi:hypothetical protein